MSRTFSIRVNQTESEEAIEKKIAKMKDRIDLFQKEGWDQVSSLQKELDQLLAFYYRHCEDSEIEASKKFPILFKTMKDMKDIDIEVG